MTKQQLRNELYDALRGMYWLPQDKDKWDDAAKVEADTLMEAVEQYAQQGKEDNG